MRDPERIPELLALLERVWTLNPDMRLGQLLVNAIRPSQACPELFHAEESRTRAGLQRLLEQGGGSGAAALPSVEQVPLDWQSMAPRTPSSVSLASVREADFTLMVETAPGRELDLYATLLELRFVGEYRHGSAGNPDAAAMLFAMAPWVWEQRPDVVLFDLSELDYQWGNSLLGLLATVAEIDTDYPIASVVLAGPRSIAGLSSLMHVFEDRAAAEAEAKRLALRRSADIG